LNRHLRAAPSAAARSFSGPESALALTTSPDTFSPRLSDDELEAAHDDLLEQFALELLIGAHQDSHWAGGNLVIATNHANIHFAASGFLRRADGNGAAPWRGMLMMDDQTGLVCAL
jgi:hypothetical protein